MAETEQSPEKQERKVEPLGPHGLQLCEHKRLSHFAEAAKGVRPEDLLDPGYWAHVSANMKPRDHIEVWAADGTWMCEAVVLDASRAFARVQIINGPHFLGTKDMAETALEQLGGFEIVHRGPRKWSVLRSKDRQVLHEGESTKDGAEKWMKDNAVRLKAEATA